MSKLLWRVVIIFILPISLQAQNPCAENHARALVMGGGGSKGAFQAGAIYHLVVHRSCDFDEISGSSVGALNGAILAQAQKTADRSDSLARLKGQSDSLIEMWQSIKSSKDVVKGRPLATMRFGLFGLESLKNFQPLHKLLEKNVSLERLEDGRILRIGTVSFHDGRYHEMVLNENGNVHPQSIDHLFGSSILPMFGAMPRIRVEVTSGVEDIQFADGALRHTTPVNSYFQVCRPTIAEKKEEHCRSIDGNDTPRHPRIEQIFVITTSPYERGQQVRPVFDQKAFSGNSQQIRDGRKIMSRALDLIMDTMYRSDLDSMYLSNDLLRWSSEKAESVAAHQDFPLRSFNTDSETLAAKPYVLGVIVPEKEDAEITAMLDFSPKRIAEQLYCGCVAADRMLQDQFGVESLASSCSERFRPYTAKKTSATNTERFTAEQCSAQKMDIVVAEAREEQPAPAPSYGQHQ